jgi:hypothetical protein
MTPEEVAGAYRELFKTAIGKDLLERLEKLFNNQLREALSADKEPAWGFINKAAGVDLVIKEITRLQNLDKKGVGRK